MRRLLPFALCLATACVFSPTNDTELSSTTSAVSVNGFLPFASTTVRIQVSSSPTGPWTQIATTQSAATGFTWAGFTHHQFTTSVIVPAALWTDTGCERVTYLRVQEAAYNESLSTYEATTSAGTSPFACLNGEVSSGESLPNAVIACRSPDSPVVTLRAPNPAATTYNGNIVVATPADAAPFACVQTLNGDLTVVEETLSGFVPTLPNIDFPNLQTVNGSVDIDYQLPMVPTGADARQVLLPSLTTVTGDLDLSSFRLPLGADLAFVHIDMDALTSVGGSVSIFSDITGTTWYGLPGLVTIPGNLSIDIFGDWSIFALLENLREVNGDVVLTLDNNGSTGLNSLRRVDGNFTENGGFHFGNDPAFMGLRSVGGDFTLVGVDSFHWLFMQLNTVGGTLRLDDSVADGSGLTVGDPFGLLVGSVDLRNNAAPTAPGIFNVEPNPFDPVFFIDNPNMCESQIDLWVNSRPFYMGTVTKSGIDTGC